MGNGVIIYQGPSVLDPSAEIVCIVTGTDPAKKSTANLKTGNMMGSWILRVDVPPHVAARNGLDRGVCGDCKHRRRCILCGLFVESCECTEPVFKRSCYVLVHNAPRSVWQCFTDGSGYRVATDEDREQIRSSVLRLGSYGDPAMVPIHVWQGIMPNRRTGYTHQWRRPEAQALRPYAMASVDTPQEAQEARALGWRYFRVRRADDPLLDREFACPATPEGGDRLQCVDCRACAGNPRGRGGNVAIVVHGSGKGAFSRLPVITVDTLVRKIEPA